MTIISAKHLNKIYSMGDTKVHALNDVSIDINAGEFIAIITGPSGSGKSTLMHVLGLLDTPDSGSYLLLGEEVAKKSDNKLSELRASHIGFVFQQFSLLPRTTALANVNLPGIYSNNHSNKNLAAELLQKVGLEQRTLHKTNELSGGQQQRVAIARALINQPPIIMADEPTGNLDSQSEKDIMGLLQDLNNQGFTIIIVTHEPEIAQYAKRIIRMRDGAIVQDEMGEAQVIDGKDHPNRLTLEKAAIKAAPIFSLKKVFTHISQAIRALTSNKVRSILSMLGIMIGVASVIAMLALGRGAQESIEKQLSSLGTNLLVVRPGASRSMGIAQESGAAIRIPLEDVQFLKNELVSQAKLAPQVNGRVQAVFKDKNWNTRVLGTTLEYAKMRSVEPTQGRFFTDGEDRERSRVAIIGLTVADELFNGQNPIGETIKLNKISFQVIGLLPEKGAGAFGDQDDMIVIPINTAMKRLLGKEFIDSFEVEVNNKEAMPDVTEQIQKLLSERHKITSPIEDVLTIRNMADIQSALANTSRIMSLLLAIIALISLLVGGIGIMNIMLVSVTERTREIGIRKAVGAKRIDILMQFLIEAVVTSLSGGLLGVAFGVTVSLVLGKFSGWPITVTADAIMLSAAFSVSTGVIFGIWPARKTASLSPIQAIRYE